MKLYSDNLASAQHAQQRWLADAAEAACGVLEELRQKEVPADCSNRPVGEKANGSSSSASDRLHLLSSLAAAFMDGAELTAGEEARMQQTQQDAGRRDAQRQCQLRLKQLDTQTSLDPDETRAESADPRGGLIRKRKRPHSGAARADCRQLFGDSHQMSIFIGGGRSDSDQRGRPITDLQRVRISWDGWLMHSLQARCTAAPPPAAAQLQPRSQSTPPPPRLPSP